MSTTGPDAAPDCVLAINDYRHGQQLTDEDPGTVYIDAIGVKVRASYEPVPDDIGFWPPDIPQIRFTLDGGRERADVQVWVDVPTAELLRDALSEALGRR